MTVLGLDASLAAIGYAIMRDGEVVIAGAKQERSRPGVDRLPLMMHFVRELFDAESEPFTVALEDSWSGRNPQTSKRLARLHGAIWEAADWRGIPVVWVAPRDWQVSAGIPMRATREVVKRRSVQIAKLRSGMDRLTEDASDAVNLSWCVYHRLALVEKVRRSA